MMSNARVELERLLRDDLARVALSATSSSIAMYAVPSSVSPWSKISMMFGWASFCAFLRLATEALADDVLAGEAPRS
jgi:hypothetical protein